MNLLDIALSTLPIRSLSSMVVTSLATARVSIFSLYATPSYFPMYILVTPAASSNMCWVSCVYSTFIWPSSFSGICWPSYSGFPFRKTIPLSASKYPFAVSMPKKMSAFPYTLLITKASRPRPARLMVCENSARKMLSPCLIATIPWGVSASLSFATFSVVGLERIERSIPASFIQASGTASTADLNVTGSLANLSSKAFLASMLDESSLRPTETFSPLITAPVRCSSANPTAFGLSAMNFAHFPADAGSSIILPA